MPAIDIDHSENQSAIRSFHNLFATQVLRPAAAEYDAKEHEKPLAIAEQVNTLIQSGAGGLKRHRYDDEKEGSGGGMMRGIAGVLFGEEVAYGSASLMLSFPGPGLAGAAIAAAGTPAQKKKW